MNETKKEEEIQEEEEEEQKEEEKTKWSELLLAVSVSIDFKRLVVIMTVYTC